ncbi:hypothetical protein J4479_01835 [Candidatus Woesearchaeota archaeon]|nr:hypothetical protein [Candidatus Woesearchaeota archaeon]
MPLELEGLVEAKTLAIFTALLNTPNKIFHLNSLAQAANVPATSAARIIKRLAKSGFIEEMKIGKISVYKLAANQKTERLRQIS